MYDFDKTNQNESFSFISFAVKKIYERRLLTKLRVLGFRIFMKSTDSYKSQL